MTWTVDIENIAGIRAGSATVEPGLNVVRGTNWQGKSSFIAALETALGTATPLTEGQPSGSVTLETPAGTVRVTLVRQDRDVVRQGDPLLTDAYDVDRAVLFACLGADNAVRAAVRRGEALEPVLTRPLEFQNLDERIAALTDERSRVESALAGADEAAKRLPRLQARVADLEETIASLRAERPDDPAGTTGAQAELSEVRAERNRVHSRVERLQGSIARTEQALADRRADLEAVDAPDGEPPTPTDAREQLASLRRDVEMLQSVFSANRLVLEEDRMDLVTDVDRAVAGDTVACWVCGAAADREALETHVGALGEEVRTLRGEVERLADEVERLEARHEQFQQAEQRRTAIEADIAELEATLDERRESLVEAEDRLAALDEQVESLSATVQASVDAAAEAESEIKFRETELEEARTELETLEARAEQAPALRERRDALAEEIAALRNRKADVKRRARSAFDDAIRDVLERFDTGFEQARLTPSFELVVARDGREASLDALSEGELELLGFVAALAGHEAFEVADRVPVLLVDDTGGLADENRRRLVEYLAGRAEYLVFTAHPEDTAVQAHEIDPRGWTVVSDGSPAPTED